MRNTSIDTTNWEWFQYDEIFHIETFHGDTLQDCNSGEIPYISASRINNGVNGFVGNQDYVSGGKITVARNGSVGSSFYQPYNFYPSPDDVRIYSLKERPLNKYIGLFLCVLIEKERYRFAYGRKFGTKRMKQSKILLPVNSYHKPDWKWIEEYSKNVLVPAMPDKAKLIWKNKYDKAPILSRKINLSDREWKRKRIFDFCDAPYKAIAYNAIDLNPCPANTPGAIPYITRSDENNGFRFYVQTTDEIKDIEKGNAISIGDTTATIKYQKNSFICSDHMVIVRSPHFNEYTGLFIVTLLSKERFRYNYGRAFSKDIIANTELLLPIVPNTNTPDWQFMEDYIKSLPYSKNI